MHPSCIPNFTSFVQGSQSLISQESQGNKAPSETPSLIEDPLWKYVCAEVVKLISVPPQYLQQAHLGPLSPQDTTVDLYCQTEEVAQFLQHYDFVILESLHPYFPAAKEVKVKIKEIA